ncbi:MAG: nucleotidyltransferase [Planctomycetota bacterium]|nr:nucleotidyltransferase [Planctomycetota bacterium]
MTDNLDPFEELCAIVDTLNEEGIEFAVCGGLAVAIYGYARTTQDIDILVKEEDLESIQNVVRPLGFDIASGFMRFNSGTPGERTIFRILKIVGSHDLMLDLILVGDFHTEVWESRSVAEYQGRKFSIVSRLGLKKMKEKAGRAKDLTDIEELGLNNVGQ